MQQYFQVYSFDSDVPIFQNSQHDTDWLVRNKYFRTLHDIMKIRKKLFNQ